MTIEEIKDRVKKEVSCEQFLTPSQKANGMFNCPFCGSGTGNHKTGALQLNKDNTVHCYSCGRHSDVIDLYCHLNHLDSKTDFRQAVKELGARIGLSTDDAFFPSYCGSPSPQAIIAPVNNTIKQQQCVDAAPHHEEPIPQKPKIDFSSYYNQCNACLFSEAGTSARDYLTNRGLTKVLKTNSFCIGFDPAADPAYNPDKSPYHHYAPRIIIPLDNHVYVARRIDGNTEARVLYPTGTSPTLFNSAALSDNATNIVFVTEGAIDALSIFEAGYQAVATNSTSNVNKLIDYLNANPSIGKCFILCFDNDSAGKEKARDKLTPTLKKLNIPFVVAQDRFYNGQKDANAALCADREKFIVECNALALQAFHDIEWLTDPDLQIHALEEIKNDLHSFRESACPSSIPDVNKQIGGAYYRGIYEIAATPSAGKTALTLQEATDIARTGRKVFYFELELSKSDLVARNVVRHLSAQKAVAYGGKEGTFLTSIDILMSESTGEILNQYWKDEKEVLEHLTIVANGNKDIDYIIGTVEKYIRFHKHEQPPLVFIDYLQIVEAYRNGKLLEGTEKIKYILSRLIEVKNKYNLIIIFTSSTSRENYYLPISIGIGKEFGDIDYACDCVMGLTLYEANHELLGDSVSEKRNNYNQLMNAPVRNTELVVTKNRKFKYYSAVGFKYYPGAEYFHSNGAEFEEQTCLDICEDKASSNTTTISTKPPKKRRAGGKTPAGDEVPEERIPF